TGGEGEREEEKGVSRRNCGADGGPVGEGVGLLGEALGFQLPAGHDASRGVTDALVDGGGDGASSHTAVAAGDEVVGGEEFLLVGFPAGFEGGVGCAAFLLDAD